MEWSVPPYFEGCGVIIARVHVISVPLARMEFWHMEAPYAKVNRPYYVSEPLLRNSWLPSPHELRHRTRGEGAKAPKGYH